MAGSLTLSHAPWRACKCAMPQDLYTDDNIIIYESSLLVLAHRSPAESFWTGQVPKLFHKP